MFLSATVMTASSTYVVTQSNPSLEVVTFQEITRCGPRVKSAFMIGNPGFK